MKEGRDTSVQAETGFLSVLNVIGRPTRPYAWILLSCKLDRGRLERWKAGMASERLTGSEWCKVPHNEPSVRDLGHIQLLPTTNALQSSMRALTSICERTASQGSFQRKSLTYHHCSGLHCHTSSTWTRGPPFETVCGESRPRCTSAILTRAQRSGKNESSVTRRNIRPPPAEAVP
jgi:hypothetical protein